jgi:thiol-disulfide isomerase/thioredoxin
MSKILRIALVIVSTVVLVIAGCSSSPAPQASAPSGTSFPIEGVQVGNLAPDFLLPNLDSGALSLNELRGKPVVLNFWATWCRPCVTEMPYLQEIYEEYSDEGLMLLAIDIDESPSQVEEFLQNNNLSLPVLLDIGGAVTKKYRIQVIPTTFFIDGDGVIQEKRMGAFINAAQIEKQLSKIMPGQ